MSTATEGQKQIIERVTTQRLADFVREHPEAGLVPLQLLVECFTAGMLAGLDAAIEAI